MRGFLGFLLRMTREGVHGPDDPIKPVSSWQGLLYPSQDFCIISFSLAMGRPIVSIKRQTDTPERALGAVITELRTSKKWSQRDLGEQIGHTEYYVSRIEKGTQSAPLDVIVNVAQAFGLRGSQLLARAEKMQEGE